MRKQFRSGAASFYIVAFSTLITMIIAISFAVVIISEVTRTENNDLAQSAYDSALAGIEDAKLAYMACLENGSREGCGNLGSQNCNQTAIILGRSYSEDGGVLIQESSEKGNNLQQAYTCVVVDTTPGNMVMSVGGEPIAVKMEFADSSAMENIESMTVEWGKNPNSGSGESTAQSSKSYDDELKDGLPNNWENNTPVLAVGIVQMGGSFTLDSFTSTKGDQTNRGLVYLVPYDGKDSTNGVDNNRYKKVESAGIGARDGFLKSNDKTAVNKPFLVACEGTENYNCKTSIKIPKPIDDTRKELYLVLSLPYGGPETSVSVAFYCGGEGSCGGLSLDNVGGTSGETSEGIGGGTGSAEIKNQIKIDSTGRANDIYRRVEARVNLSGTAAGALYAVNVNELIKDITPTCEQNFIIKRNSSPNCS